MNRLSRTVNMLSDNFVVTGMPQLNPCSQIVLTCVRAPMNNVIIVHCIYITTRLLNDLPPMTIRGNMRHNILENCSIYCC